MLPSQNIPMSVEFPRSLEPKHKAHRALRWLVRAGRAIGVLLVALAVLSFFPPTAFGPLGPGLRLLAAVALGLVGIAWIFGLELFLRLFDGYLSRN